VVVLASVGALAIRWPQILGNGYDAVDQALRGELALALLFGLPFLKLVASGASSGAGVPGGLFTPSLFFGGLLGGGLGAALQLIWPGAPPVPAFVLVGMGAALAGTTHATMAAVLIIFEMTRDYAMVVPLLLACYASTAVSRAIVPHSIYTGVLKRRGIRLPTPARPGWLDEGSVAQLVRPAHTVGPGAPFAELAVKLLELPWGVDLHVVDGGGQWLGTASLAALKAHLPDQSALSMVVAADVMNSAVQPLTVASSLADARDRLSRLPVEELPVVDSAGKLIGAVRRRELAGRVTGP
jgi:CIC family chloride channel protein